MNACTNKKNTVVTRNYHNLTSRFNGLFNGKESYKEGVKKLNLSLKEDYDKILPLFNYGTMDESKAIHPEMDKAFKKGSSVIERHSIRIKGKEYCKWIDETYILIGKSHLYKHDYFLAIESFDFVASQFKKEPTRFEAKIWKIKTLNEIGNLSEAEDLIDEIKIDKKFPKKIYAEDLAAVEADLYLRQKNPQPAISWLRKALKLTKSKQNKIRYNYILAQLYQDQGDNKKALNYFEAVLKLHPKYEMAFYARLNKARVMEGNSKNSKSVKRELISMSKDGKNEEYRDQILYTLAQISIKENDIEKAEEYLKLSIKESKSNKKQKGKSCLMLADMYYNQTEYINAQQYYDSAVTFLPKDYSGFSFIENKKNNLGKLVAYIDTIKTEDSLQRMSRMTDKDIEKIIQMEIERKTKEYYLMKKAAKEATDKAEQNANNPSPTNTGNPFGSGGAWYFYNPTTVSFGINEFTKKWGNRKLEDNWRRINKAIAISIEDTGKSEPTLSEEELDQQALEKIKEPGQYLAKIPKGDAAKIESEKRLSDAYYNLGVIYTQQLDNKEKGAEAFENLIDRFPQHPDKLTIYYQLYRLYLSDGNNAKATKYKELLIKSDPNSEYSQLINNPNYDATADAPESKVAKLYEVAYETFQKGDYKSVIVECNTALKLYKNSYLIPKFDYLHALSIGKIDGIDALEKSLKEILLKYPGDPIRNEAQNLLSIISTYKKSNQDIVPSSNATSVDTSTIKNISPFVFKDTIHYYLLLYPKEYKEGSVLSNRINDFNNTFYSLLNLGITSIAIGESNGILVRTFDNKLIAMDYYNTVKINSEVFNNIDINKITQFVLTQDNLQILLKENKPEDYERFFKKEYLALGN
jgi:tetratricopeptide (TPR) repeat protein